MTLVVSVRVPDGIVLAVDSLSTTMGRLNIEANVEGTCEKCGAKMQLQKLQVPPIGVPASTATFAQKLFPFRETFGIATYGNTSVNKQSLYSQIKQLERRLSKEIVSVDDAAKELGKHFMHELEQEVGDMSKLPEGHFSFGFQVVGFTSPEATTGKTWAVQIGKQKKEEKFEAFGCTVSGDRRVVLKLWKEEKEMPVPKPTYGSFSLQDAIDYADFLIRTTSDYQRFANMIPTVGGEIDIALVAPYSGFKWIRVKPLARLLEHESS